MNLRLRHREIELQLDAKDLGKLFLLKHGFEHRDIEFRKLAVLYSSLGLVIGIAMS
jgi:hypothetical protein